MVKKSLLILALLLSVLLSALTVVASVAHAESVSWVRVVEDNVLLYSSDDGKKQVFVLEKSYYLQVLDQTDLMYFVMVSPEGADFPKITGYVYKNSVKICDIPPLDPYYPTEKIVVTGSSAEILLSPVKSAETVVSAMNTQKMSYYGSIVNNGITWYYVYFAKQFGYVDSAFVSKPNVSLHPTPLPQKPVNSYPSDNDAELPAEETQKNAPTSEILLIVFVVLLAVGLTLALFLPGNIKKRSNVFEQDI